MSNWDGCLDWFYWILYAQMAFTLTEVNSQVFVFVLIDHCLLVRFRNRNHDRGSDCKMHLALAKCITMYCIGRLACIAFGPGASWSWGYFFHKYFDQFRNGKRTNFPALMDVPNHVTHAGLFGLSIGVLSTYTCVKRRIIQPCHKYNILAIVRQNYERAAGRNSLADSK